MAQLCAGTCRATLAWLVDKGAGYTSGSSLHIDIYMYLMHISSWLLLLLLLLFRFRFADHRHFKKKSINLTP